MTRTDGDFGRSGAGAQASFRGALLGVALGDALGAPYEGSPPQSPEAFAGWEDELPHPLRYTDDTHMTIGLARSLVAKRGEVDATHLAETWADLYRAEPWRGYGAGPPRIFARLARGVPAEKAALELFGGAGSYGNGAAMRVAPVGLVSAGDLPKADELARETARLTHAHPAGQDGAAIVACAVALLAGAEIPLATLADIRAFLETLRLYIRDPDFARAFEALCDLPLEAPQDRALDSLGNGIEAQRSVPAAIYAFLRHPDSFARAITYAVSLGGDADTIAAMCGALAGARVGEGNLPCAWRARVEGADALTALADSLLAIRRARL